MRVLLKPESNLGFIGSGITPFLTYESVLQCITRYFGGINLRALVLMKAVYNETVWSIPIFFIDTALTLNRYDALENSLLYLFKALIE